MGDQHKALFIEGLAGGSGGSGGTSDYTQLTNKPSINGTILIGNKTLADLGIEWVWRGTRAQYEAAAATILPNTFVDITDEPDMDTVPTQGSLNPVTSNGVYDEIYGIKSDINVIEDAVGVTVSSGVFWDSYNANNTNDSITTTAPFIIVPKQHGTVTSVKINIKAIGYLHIGKILKSDVVYGAAFDYTKVQLHEKMEFSNVGTQIYELTNPMSITENECIVICDRADTAVFAYGPYGVDAQFFYVHDGNVTRSDNRIGVTYIGTKAELENKSVYKNKKLSILGDSISTYDGYIPSGNVTYYPAGTIQSVNDTWWKKLIDALGMTLDVNNSWSGSRVTTTAGNESAGCGTRCEALGTSPDVIIVYMGINDFNNDVVLGTYDGTTVITETTTTFREAYGIMLNKILTKYQTAEVWVCTLPQCERNGETGFPEINGNDVALAEFNKAIVELANAFGVKVLDHNKCGLTYQNMPTYNPDSLHPNKKGHSLMANNDIWQMDNYVRTRY